MGRLLENSGEAECESRKHSFEGFIAVEPRSGVPMHSGPWCSVKTVGPHDWRRTNLDVCVKMYRRNNPSRCSWRKRDSFGCHFLMCSFVLGGM